MAKKNKNKTNKIKTSKVATYLNKIIDLKAEYPYRYLHIGRFSAIKPILSSMFNLVFKNAHGWYSSWCYDVKKAEEFKKKILSDFKFNPSCVIAEHENPIGFVFVLKGKVKYHFYLLLKKRKLLEGFNRFDGTYPCFLTKWDGVPFLNEFEKDLEILNKDEWARMKNILLFDSLKEKK